MKNDSIQNAASEITGLWWAHPEENGHIKTQVVAEIIRKHLAMGSTCPEHPAPYPGCPTCGVTK